MSDSEATPAPSPDGGYSIRLSKQAFTFCAGHFITYAGDICEPIHGHNYGVAIEAEGPLEGNAYVLDFVATRDTLAAIAASLDHRMLLPTEHPLIRVEKTTGPLGGEEVVATFRDRRWVFPANECALLPIDNTTAERLAEWIGRRLLTDLAAAGVAVPQALTVSVDECEGQVGVCRLPRS